MADEANDLYVPGENAKAKPILKASEIAAEVRSWAEANGAAAQALVERIGVLTQEKKAASEILGTVFEVIGGIAGVLKK